MDICSIEADDGDKEEKEDVYSDEDENEKDPEKSSSDEGLNESGERNYVYNVHCKCIEL